MDSGKILPRVSLAYAWEFNIQKLRFVKYIQSQATTAAVIKVRFLSKQIVTVLVARYSFPIGTKLGEMDLNIQVRYCQVRYLPEFVQWERILGLLPGPKKRHTKAERTVIVWKSLWVAGMQTHCDTRPWSSYQGSTEGQRAISLAAEGVYMEGVAGNRWSRRWSGDGKEAAVGIW